MLPTEPPLPLHRLVAPIPPARPREVAAATHQVPAPAPVQAVPVPVSNATVAHGMHAPAKTPPTAAQDQLGNAATTKAAAQATPAAPLLVMPMKTRCEDAPSR
ncbi:hypothetical protein [Streptomyces violaceusniger]|uniref:Uncharacterized protein n=1 Tax=Streptomyces violaceusniger (strain Tu 4113) TaxID=653045 RepID=G2PEU4_STRV4|nr:hypothetical protein [Streptomyces violaceusniger]AEM83804.1 hypothetical protein Strvi_4148 [Streptomyces violaceusniger Tu 4113]